MSTVLSIAAIGGTGPKATVISFVKDENGNRPWAWMPNETAAMLVPGMRLAIAQVDSGKIATTYTKDGVEVALKVPKVQLFLGGTIEVLPPDQPELAPLTVVFSDQARAYAEAYRAKQAQQQDSSHFGDEEDL
jgi:hypothetical protein